VHIDEKAVRNSRSPHNAPPFAYQSVSTFKDDEPGRGSYQLMSIGPDERLPSMVTVYA
jgi:hypothetical protein